ncbi:hypothetical protein [Actinomyces howellii]|uniref:Uncharacterized protein n=1 Tax=Actinomyces howellii TaxID=52771 RepID=A0A448HIX1_9ACTO|nr:hypothetical protein [Actinomyces howellii]VEG29605.1 Uncharacterised protein [Actinomyces howellii]
MSYPPAYGPPSTSGPYGSPAPQPAAPAGYQWAHGQSAQGGPGGYAPQHPYAQVPTPSPGAPQGLKAPIILLVSGVVVGLLGVLAFTIPVIYLYDTASSMSAFPTNRSATAQLEAGTEYGLYSETSATCTVVDPDGTELPVAAPTWSVTVDRLNLLAYFTPEVTGPHTISCSSSSSSVVAVSTLIDESTVLRMSVVMMVGIALLIIGTPLFLAGGIWLIVRVSNNRKVVRQRVAAQYSGVGPDQWPAA